MDVLLPLLFALGTAAWLAYAIRRTLRHLQFFQIEEYDNARFLAFLWAHRARIVMRTEVGLVLALATSALLASAALPQSDPLLAIAFLIAWIAVYAALFGLRKLPASKKPLVLTPRATRLCVTSVVLAAALFLALSVIVLALPQSARPALWVLALVMIGGLVLDHLIGLLLVAANGINFPVEETFRRYFVHSARKKFKSHGNLKVVAVTGSYGKTSTKEIIADVLSARYRVLKTPRSFNTLMGICKVIREELQPEHRVFVVEMGAYKKGEINRLCDLTPPEIGIITAIGPQHLERFKSVERVAEAKYELMEHLPNGGIGIFNGDDALCQKLSQRPGSFRAMTYGVDPNGGRLNVRASNVRVSAQGTEFDVCTENNATVHFVTPLLGRYNVSNILAATCVGIACGLSLEQIAARVRTLKPVEHRLERINGAGGVVVIDDAYNSNPAGVRMALEVLASLPGGRKILITPGMVELGDREEQEHRQMGQLAAESCDFVILVGATRTRAIAEGLAEKGFPAERLAVVANLEEATQRLQTMVRSGDVVLFENDLPDTYAAETIYF